MATFASPRSDAEAPPLVLARGYGQQYVALRAARGGDSMIFGLPPLTFIHTAISLIGIATGLVVLFFGLLANERLPRWTSWFLATTVLTSVTGFLLPAPHFLPSHAVGILSLLVLAVTLFALYSKHLTGGWRRTYVITAVIALYLNVFVLVAQLFAKVPALKELAPTQTEGPFKVAQGVVLVAFIVLGALAATRFHPREPSAASRAA
jgi:hypothetical protein